MTKGITITQAGVGVEQALDAQKIVDSRWHYFEMAFEKVLSLGNIRTSIGPTSAGDTIELFIHSLNFLPAFDVYNITTGLYMTGNTTGGFRADKNRIFITGSFDTTGVSNSQLLLRVYNVPITEEYEAPIQKTLPVKGSTLSKTGIKVTTRSHGMTQQELSTYTLNTEGKALAIQKTGTVFSNSGTNNQAVITHNVGYPPTYLAAEADPAFNFITPVNPSFVPVLSSADAKILTFKGAQAALTGTWAYIIFKELADFAI